MVVKLWTFLITFLGDECHHKWDVHNMLSTIKGTVCKFVAKKWYCVHVQNTASIVSPAPTPRQEFAGQVDEIREVEGGTRGQTY